MTEIATHSVVVIIPANLRADANRISHALGYQPEDGLTFSRELEDALGNRFFGTRWWAPKAFRDVVTRRAAPPAFDRAAFALTNRRVTDTLAGLIVDERLREEIADGGYSHWADVLTARGLIEVEQGERI